MVLHVLHFSARPVGAHTKGPDLTSGPSTADRIVEPDRGATLSRPPRRRAGSTKKAYAPPCAVADLRRRSVACANRSRKTNQQMVRKKPIVHARTLLALSMPKRNCIAVSNSEPTVTVLG